MAESRIPDANSPSRAIKSPSPDNKLGDPTTHIPAFDSTNFSLAEMLALPEDQRNALAIRLCASYPEPLQLMALCSTEDAYKAVSDEVMRREQESPEQLSIAEILALPEDERNALAESKGVVCRDPFTVMAIGCAPPNNSYLPSHEDMRRYTEECEPLPDEDEDEVPGADGKRSC